MKKLILSLSIVSIALFTFDASAKEPGERGRRGSADAGADGARRGRGGPGADRDPAQLVSRMMQEFDKDGDQKLDSTELTALLKSMRDRRGGAARSGGPSGARPGQKKQGAEGRGRRSNDTDSARAGGERPKRPRSE